jgi:hypothetical protein
VADIAADKKIYDDTLAKWKKMRDDFENAVKSDKAHLKSTRKKLASLARGGGYRANGYFYIKTRGRRAVYDKTAVELGNNLKAAKKKAVGSVTAGSTAHGALYQYNSSRTSRSGKQYNFLSGYMPYQNEAHHLLPVEAVPGAFKGEKRRLLEKLPYNINHGQNIIFLPKRIGDATIHNLPQHSGSHPKYNTLVKTDLNTVASHLTAKQQQDCEEEDPPPIAVLNEMIDLQNGYWDLLVKEGAVNINKLAERETAKRQQAASVV